MGADLVTAVTNGVCFFVSVFLPYFWVTRAGGFKNKEVVRQ